MTTVNKRKSGVLLPVFSLPSGYGCGTFGKGAYRFIDKISQAGFSVWQLLPLCPTDSYHSPYMSCASFAGNTDFIDLDALIEEDLLKKEECEGAKETTPYSCEWDKLGKERRKLLRKAYERQGADEAEQYFKSDIRIKNAAEFLALRAQNGGKYFTEWSEKTVKKDEYLFELYLQYLFYTQWKKLKEYANSKGIEIWGDMPFYVSPDSSDVYNNKQSFLLEKDGTPSCVAGVPPDYFAKDGQFWGNPIYDWKHEETTGFEFTRERTAHSLSLYDKVRLDHFRAFSEYWSIPSFAKTAKDGKWVEGPGKACIDAIKKVAGDGRIVAENLGVIDAKANSLLSYSGFPGMAVFQFGFDGDPFNCHLPHNYAENTVAYTGTHDNNTLLGFMWESDENTRKNVLEYIGYRGEDWSGCYESIIRILMMSKANDVIFPIQDILGFGGDTRFNTPGKPDGNWSFRITGENVGSIDAAKWKRMNRLYSRI